MIKAFVGAFGACFLGENFARGLIPEKTDLPPRIFFLGLPGKLQNQKSKDEIVHNVYYVWLQGVAT